MLLSLMKWRSRVMAHSKRDNVLVTRNTAMMPGTAIPPFIGMTHRHFEKSPPGRGKMVGGVEEFVGPLDMVRLTCPAPIVEPFTTLILGYKGKK